MTDFYYFGILRGWGGNKDCNILKNFKIFDIM